MSINRIMTEDLDLWYGEEFPPEIQDALRTLARSQKVQERKRCAEWLKEGASVDANKALVLELADLLIPDRNNDIRWGILTIALSPILRDWEPEQLWPLVVKWGSVKNRDIRTGVGVCVLEHILEHHFDEYFRRSKQLIEGGNRLFGFTLSCCGKWGQTQEPANAEAFDALVAPFARLLPKSSSPTAAA